MSLPTQSINPPLAIIIIIEKKYGSKHLPIRMRAQTSTSDDTQSINPSVAPFKFSFSFDPAGLSRKEESYIFISHFSL